MTGEENKRYCLHCNKEINGSKRKKFCNDSCRMDYHNGKHKSLLGDKLE